MAFEDISGSNVSGYDSDFGVPASGYDSWRAAMDGQPGMATGSEFLPGRMHAGADAALMPSVDYTPTSSVPAGAYLRPQEVEVTKLSGSAAEAAAAAACALKPRLLGGTRFVGPDLERPDMQYFQEAWVDEIDRLSARKFDGESRPDKAAQAILDQADAGLEEIGRLANVEIGPPQGPVRIFRKPKNYVAAYKKINEGDAPPDVGNCDGQAGVLWTWHGTTVDEVGLIHERVHQRSLLKVKPLVIVTGPDVHVRVEITGGCTGGVITDASSLDEALTDMTQMRIQSSSKRPFLQAYLGTDILLGGIIGRTAQRLGMTEQEIEFSLYRAKFGGDDEGLDLVREVMGVDKTNFFLHVGKITLDEAELAAHILGLPETATRVKHAAAIKAAGRGAPPMAYEWLPNADHY